MGVATVSLKSWNDIHAFGRRGWVFRGQGDASWNLKTSLERLFELRAVKDSYRRELESELIREFMRAYHNYSTHIPRRENILEWLSLMQHHGAPTRLLDFTYSVYVAAYFALEATEKDCSIWGVRADWLAVQSIRRLKKTGKRNVEELRRRTGERHEIISDDVLFRRPLIKTVLLLNPFRLNERLRIQKGIFLIPGRVQNTFMENLQAVPGHDRPTNILKITLPKSIRAQALERLFYMNVSRTSLFPGLDGYARSLGVFHPAFNPAKY